MSWGFNVTGTKEALLKKIAEAKPTYGDTESPQWAAIRALLLAEVEAWNPPEGTYSNALKIEACGHHDAQARNFRVQLDPVRIDF